MKKYKCSICGYIYDEAKGNPEAGIAPGTKWENLPDNWVCPLCSATKAEFKEEGIIAAPSKPRTIIQENHSLKELSPLETSAICSNLARGCEKQYHLEEAALFTELAEYFQAATAPAETQETSQLLTLIENDLTNNFPTANALSAEINDRGAMRALVWSEKVTRILNSLLTRYEKEGEAMLTNTGIYVCTICGFIYLGDNLPEICPVCKVPSWKFEKIEGGVQ